jgi:hypothetical protein
MKARHNPERQPAKLAGRRSASRGVALIITLLILMLLVAMTLAMTITVTSDTIVNKYYRNARASFYAGDSGVNIARQYMINQIVNSISYSANYTTATAPISSTATATVLSNTISQFGSPTSIDGGLGTGSWPSSFQIEQSYTGAVGTTLPATTPTPACSVIYSGTPTNQSPYTCANLPTGNGVAITGYTYTYTIPYAITAVGQSLANEQQVIEDEGTITLNINEGNAPDTQMSFAAFGTFIDSYPICSSPFAPGTLTGRFFTNGAWTFEPGTYTFTGALGSVSTQFGNQFSKSCTDSTTEPQKSGSQTISPSFQSTVTLGATPIPLPANDFAQKEAVVDGVGNQWVQDNYSTAQQDAAMNAALKTVDGNATPYPVNGTTNSGVYMAYSQQTVNGVTTNTMTGGGIYVEGNASAVELAAATGTNGDSEEVYTITQGTSVTTVTTDLTALRTTVSSTIGGNTTSTVINGVPENFSTGTETPATMLYVDGNIGNSSTTGLSGPESANGAASTGPAIQNGAQITITAAGTIDVTGSILYATEPVTETQSQSVSSSLTTTACCSGDPADTLIPYANPPTGVLGLFTATGDIAEYNQQTNTNIEIDAALAMISTGGTGGWINDGNTIGTITVVGGRVANKAKMCNCSTRNIYFDQRFANGNFAPPWFPSTTISQSNSLSVNSVTPTFQRTLWLSMN